MGPWLLLLDVRWYPTIPVTVVVVFFLLWPPTLQWSVRSSFGHEELHWWKNRRERDTRCKSRISISRSHINFVGESMDGWMEKNQGITQVKWIDRQRGSFTSYWPVQWLFLHPRQRLDLLLLTAAVGCAWEWSWTDGGGCKQQQQLLNTCSSHIIYKRVTGDRPIDWPGESFCLKQLNKQVTTATTQENSRGLGNCRKGLFFGQI